MRLGASIPTLAISGEDALKIFSSQPEVVLGAARGFEYALMSLTKQGILKEVPLNKIGIFVTRDFPADNEYRQQIGEMADCFGMGTLHCSSPMPPRDVRSIFMRWWVQHKNF